MKSLYSIIFILLLSASACLAQREGQAGATQLLINPFARSSGFHGANCSNTYGIESVITNPAGVSLTRRTEVVFANTRLLTGSGMSINALGVSQALGKDGSGGVLGFNIVSLSVGEIPITTIDSPDNTLGTFKPSFMNLGLTYSRQMVPDRIMVGFTVKLVTEGVTNANAAGVGIDAGVQYHDRADKLKIGVALRNIGPEMKYSGDGLSFRASTGGANGLFDSAVRTEASNFQLPSQLLIGVSYDIRFGAVFMAKERAKKSKDKSDSTSVSEDKSLEEADTTADGKKRKPKVEREVRDHRVTPLFSFVSNSFSNDQFGLGLEYSFRDMFMIRAAYLLESGLGNKDKSQNVYSGLAAGASFEMPFGKIDSATRRRKSTIGIDYSYRLTYYFTGTHSIGIRFNL